MPKFPGIVGGIDRECEYCVKTAHLIDIIVIRGVVKCSIDCKIIRVVVECSIGYRFARVVVECSRRFLQVYSSRRSVLAEVL